MASTPTQETTALFLNKLNIGYTFIYSIYLWSPSVSQWKCNNYSHQLLVAPASFRYHIYAWMNKLNIRYTFIYSIYLWSTSVSQWKCNNYSLRLLMAPASEQETTHFALHIFTHLTSCILVEKMCIAVANWKLKMLPVAKCDLCRFITKKGLEIWWQQRNDNFWISYCFRVSE